MCHIEERVVNARDTRSHTHACEYVDDDSQSETTSSLSDLGFDNFSSALVGSTPAISPKDPVRLVSGGTAQRDSVTVNLPEADGRQFDRSGNGASASAEWNSRPVLATMAFLMMFSSAQLIMGFLFSLALIGIPSLITALMGLLVSFGYLMGYLPGDTLSSQLHLVRHKLAARLTWLLPYANLK